MVYHDLGRSGVGGWNRSRWMHTPVGRVIVGVLLAQGLFYALRHLFTGVIMMLDGDGVSVEAWTSFHGLLFLQALQVLAPALGGVLAGAGHRGGSVLGALVGVVHGALSIALSPAPVQSTSAVTMYALPLLQTLFGGLGGMVGTTIWKPPQAVTFMRAEKKEGVARPRIPVFSGPIAWLRVLLGSALAVTGSLFATQIFEAVLNAGHWDIPYLVQDEILTWEVKAFAVLIGAGIAGANTFNGLKQGLCVGVFTSLAVLAVPSRHSTTMIYSLMLVSSMLLSLAGGWFGSQLLPPIIKYRRHLISDA
jgi:hypothetical protein